MALALLSASFQGVLAAAVWHSLPRGSPSLFVLPGAGFGLILVYSLSRFAVARREAAVLAERDLRRPSSQGAGNSAPVVVPAMRE